MMSKKRKSKKIRPRVILSAAQKGAVDEAVEVRISRQMAEKKGQIVADITDQVAEMAVVAAAVAAFDTFGTAGGRLEEFNNKFLAQFDCIIAETVSLDDLKGLLEVEAFLRIVDIKDMRNSDKPLLVGAGAHRCIWWRGEVGSIRYWAEKFGIRPQTVSSRLARGWELERALTEPVKG